MHLSEFEVLRAFWPKPARRASDSDVNLARTGQVASGFGQGFWERDMMTRILLAAIAGCCIGSGALADDLIGSWRTAPDDNGHSGLVEVGVCDSSLCGTLVEAFDASGASVASDNIGRQIIWDTLPRGDGEYRGRIYAPDRDQEYRSKLQLNGDTLVVSGCVMGGAICREGGQWTRQ